MSYDTVKNGIAGRLKAQGFQESSQVLEFKDASSMEYGNTFILRAVDGQLNEDTDEVNTRFDDAQMWEVQLAFSRSTHNDLAERDIMHRKREAVIKDLDNYSNWSSFVKFLRYSTWSIEELDNYFLVRINFRAVDRISY